VVERLISGGVEAALGTRLVRARPMGGGCIGEVYEAELSEGSKAVAKVDRAGESHLEREAYMLRYLGDKSDLPVPKVYHHSETLLLMEFVEGGGNLSGAEEHAAELLAALHGITAEASPSRTRGRRVGSNSSGTNGSSTPPGWLTRLAGYRRSYAPASRGSPARSTSC
jgi:RIO-like serine/threonine protein kinase